MDIYTTTNGLKPINPPKGITGKELRLYLETEVGISTRGMDIVEDVNQTVVSDTSRLPEGTNTLFLRARETKAG